MDSERENTMSNRARKLESLLAAKLTEFLESDVVYALRRVLAAEINQLYRGPQEGKKWHNTQMFFVEDLDRAVTIIALYLIVGESTAVNDVLKELTQNAELHPTKGGMKVNEYLTFNWYAIDSFFEKFQKDKLFIYM